MSKTATDAISVNRRGEWAPILRSGGWALLCLLGVMGYLFARSLNPALVLFANDAPLGLLRCQEANALSNYLGAWQDNSWIGAAQPSSLPDVTYSFYLLVGALGYAKFYVPCALLLLGISVWFFLHRLGFSVLSCVLGGLAAALSTDPFSYACWGLAPIGTCMAAIFTALGVVAPDLRGRRWAQLALAGLCVGFSILEGYDTGAILSLYVAAFVLFQALTEPGEPARRFILGGARVMVVALLAAFMAAQALSTLIGTQVKGIVGSQQDDKTKEKHWNEATIWSLPKLETLRLVIPGVFGYRMDTADGGNYWGAVGQNPGVPQSRHSGAGVYSGVFVVLLAAFALAQAGRKEKNPFTPRERKFVWFWGGAALVSLLLAYGRYAPFYQFFYRLPYFSTIRNPIKFMHPFTIAMVALFGYGVEGLYRNYLQKNLLKGTSLVGQVKSWWQNITGFEKKWTLGSGAVLVASALGYLLYASSRRDLEAFMQTIASEAYGFPPSLIPEVAKFSTAEVGWFVLFLALSVGAVILILSGGLSGRRARWASVLLGAILIADFARANAPWIIYWDYNEKYATNPVIDQLRDKPYEHRVAARMTPMSGPYLVAGDAQGFFSGIVDREWAQQHYPYYRIQSVDIVQMPRMPEMDAAYLFNFAPKNSGQLFPVGRLWQLTSTRYLLAMASFVDAINQQIDPTNHSFRVRTPFDFASREGGKAAGAARMEDVTTVVKPDGQFAILEFGAALARAQLYSQWEVITDDTAALKRLADPAFDPRRGVLVSDPIAGPAAGAQPGTGSAAITHYEPKRITVRAEANGPAVLLLNDKFDPNWKVTVDGTSAPLLRCNYIMRGVSLQAGTHTVEFRYDPPHPMLFVSLAALVLGIALSCWLAFVPPPKDSTPTAAPPARLEAARAKAESQPLKS